MKLKTKKIGLTARKGLVGYQFVLPFIIGMVVLFIPSLIQTMVYSFFDVNLTIDGLKTTFCGFDNFKRAFLEDTEFRELLLQAVKNILIDVVSITMFSLFIAVILNQKFFGRGLARTIFFLPVVLATGLVASVSAGDMMMNAFSATGGDTGSQLSQSTIAILDLRSLLQSSQLGNGMVQIILSAVDGVAELVNNSGVQILISLAGLQSISPSLFEASKVEGATSWETFWKVTFPIMQPILLVNIIYTIVDTYIRPSYGILTFIEGFAYEAGDMGYASVLSVLYFAVTMLFMLAVWLLFGRKISYID